MSLTAKVAEIAAVRLAEQMMTKALRFQMLLDPSEWQAMVLMSIHAMFEALAYSAEIPIADLIAIVAKMPPSKTTEHLNKQKPCPDCGQVHE